MQYLFIDRVKIENTSTSGCYISPPLELDFVLVVGHCEQLRIMLSLLGLQLLGPLGAFTMFPLNLYQRYLLIVHDLHLPSHYCYRPLNII